MTYLSLEDVDVRAKFLALVLLSVALYMASAAAVAGLAFVVAGVYLMSGVRLRELAGEMKLVIVIVVAGVVGRVATEPSLEGLFAGSVAGGRFVVIVSLAYLVASTSTSGEMEAAVESTFRWIPIVRESDWAAMFGASVRFLPVVSDEVREVRRAHRSRLGIRRRFDQRLKTLAYPMLVGSLRRADTLAYAMASRAYSPDRTRLRRLDWRRMDSLTVLAATGIAVAVVLL